MGTHGWAQILNGWDLHQVDQKCKDLIQSYSTTWYSQPCVIIPQQQQQQ